jgi:hypothetical protein
MKILLLGNGTSRLQHDQLIKNWKDPIWACNLAFKENYNISLIGTVHEWVVNEAIKSNFNGEILTPKTFKLYNGYASGSELVIEAIERGYEEIHLLGYDSIENGNTCVYSGKVVIVNFKNQLDRIIKRYNLKKIKLSNNYYKLIK